MGYLGSIVFNEVGRGKRSRASLIRCMEKHNLSDELIGLIPDKVAFKRAAKVISRSGGRKLTPRRIQDGDDAVITLVREVKSRKDNKLIYQQVATFTLHKKNGKISCSGNKDLGQEFTKAYKTLCRRVTDEDIRSLIRKVIDESKGVSLRHQGAIYFVPKSNHKDIKALNDVLEEMDFGSLNSLPAINEASVKEIVWKSALADVYEKLKFIMTAVENINHRSVFLDKQMVRVRGLEKLLNFYAKLCSPQKTGLAEARLALRVAKKTIVKKGTNLSKEPPRKERKKYTKRGAVAA